KWVSRSSSRWNSFALKWPSFAFLNKAFRRVERYFAPSEQKVSTTSVTPSRISRRRAFSAFFAWELLFIQAVTAPTAPPNNIPNPRVSNLSAILIPLAGSFTIASASGRWPITADVYRAMHAQGHRAVEFWADLKPKDVLFNRLGCRITYHLRPRNKVLLTHTRPCALALRVAYSLRKPSRPFPALPGIPAH